MPNLAPNIFGLATSSKTSGSGSPVKTAVIPVAGDGTRMFPVTLATQKSILPVGNKALIHYAVEEALLAGCEKIVIVHGPEDRRQYSRAFGQNLAQSVEEKIPQKDDMRRIIEEMRSYGHDIELVTQDKPLGLGHGVLEAEKYIGEAPFLVILPDDLILEGLIPTASRDMISAYKSGISIAAQKVDKSETKAYGIFIPEKGASVDTLPMAASGMVEKPNPDSAPSNLAAIGRYILPPGIMDVLRDTGRGSGGEIQLTDAIEYMRRHDGTAITATSFSGIRFDCGNHMGKAMADLYVSAQILGPEVTERLLKLALPGTNVQLEPEV